MPEDGNQLVARDGLAARRGQQGQERQLPGLNDPPRQRALRTLDRRPTEEAPESTAERAHHSLAGTVYVVIVSLESSARTGRSGFRGR